VVIADPKAKTDALFEAMGHFVANFGGTYITAEDVNVGIPDLRCVRRTTSHVTGLSVEEGGGGNPRAATALGCFLGLGAALLEATGSADVADKTVAVQGLGSVGFGLAEHLAGAGARVIATDVNHERLTRAVGELGVEVASADGIYDVECDVFAPCALGGVLNDETIGRLCCSVIAGAANNQLLDEVRHGEMLRDRGILYAPDYVINAGGVINISCELRPGGYDAELALREVHSIPQTLAKVFARARERGITTHAAAQELAEAALAAGPSTAR
jgi:leucine dehydrogenase